MCMYNNPLSNMAPQEMQSTMYRKKIVAWLYGFPNPVNTGRQMLTSRVVVDSVVLHLESTSIPIGWVKTNISRRSSSTRELSEPMLGPGIHLGYAMPWASKQMTAQSVYTATRSLSDLPWCREGVWKTQTHTDSPTQISTSGSGEGRNMNDAAAGGELKARGGCNSLFPLPTNSQERIILKRDFRL